ncbi:MAG: MOSC domain-containing protein [Pseudonocardiaceae bacterium]|nr:MOSC domain-containing protein [Pseudonocardiaceae bacterium]
MTATVAALRYYPVKGCRGVEVPRSQVLPTGLANDRLFMLVDSEGRFLSQRRVRSMAVITPELLDAGERLVFRAPGFAEVEHPVIFDGARLDVSVFSWSGKGVDQGDVVSHWLSDVLGMECRLVRVPPEHDRDTGGEHAGKAGFADGHPMLVTSLSSLDGLNARILELGGSPVPMERFRPNLVLRGWQRPHTEDDVREMSCGSLKLGFAKVCTRCAVPTVDQDTGERAGPEPIRTLAGYRRSLDGGVTFGMKAAVLEPGELAVGEELTVIRWA